VPAFLALVVVFGLVAVVVGNLLVQAAARRQAAAPLAFVDSPPVTVAPEGSTVTGLLSRSPTHAPARPPWYRRTRLHRPGAATLLFVLCSALYLTVGGILVLHYGSIVGDAQSRVADGWYVFFSRDPHLAAIGFVWNPLPSVLVMPLFLFKGVFPALTERGFAGDIMSALFMAGCVVQLRAILRQLDVPALVTWVLVVVFALNPMVIYYGANGMTEALYLFFLLLGVRYLAQWIHAPRIGSLVAAGSALGFGYLVRYEAAFAAAAAGGLVLVVSFFRARGSRRKRLQAAACDVLVFGLPPAAAFIGWAVVSYVITGHLFEQFSSQYGISAQVSVLGGAHLQDSLLHFETLQLLAYAPLLPVVGALAIASAWRRRDARVLALGTLVGTVVFTFGYALIGGSIPFFRYLFPAYPLWILCIGVVFARAPHRGRVSVAYVASTGVAALLAAALALTSTATVALAMNDSQLGSAERQNLHWIFTGRPETAYEHTLMVMVRSEHKITNEIDAMGLPSGSVVMDTFTPCVSTILMMSSHPHQFVITSDRDFQRVLADPITFKAGYMLLPPRGGYGDLDELNRTYPNLFRSGRGAHLAKEFKELGCPHFRLYKLANNFRETAG
jgi:4-amino-4-deoxy-L-arabinose transferase-like glycosyltransferase